LHSASLLWFPRPLWPALRFSSFSGFIPCKLPHPSSVAFLMLFSSRPRPGGQLDSLPTPPLSKHLPGEGRWIVISATNAVLKGAGSLAPSPAQWQGDPGKHDGSSSGAHPVESCACANPVSFLAHVLRFLLRNKTCSKMCVRQKLFSFVIRKLHDRTHLFERTAFSCRRRPRSLQHARAFSGHLIKSALCRCFDRTILASSFPTMSTILIPQSPILPGPDCPSLLPYP